ncbi:MAG: alpha/beta hydrolase [Chloroflexia bacterium]|nr:alpha/beta hydrolase [Chloroflexia bacterium]
MTNNLRTYGPPPYHLALVHGGPGAAGEMAPVARELAAAGRGVLEPLQTARSLDGQVEELRALLEPHAASPLTLLGFSWGAWLVFVLAARYPDLPARIILVGSGPFEQRYVAQLARTRLGRLDEGERAEFERIVQALADPAGEDKDALLARLGALADKTDTLDPLPGALKSSALLPVQGNLFQRVWQEAAELRRSGELLALGRRVACPVLAIHGDYDPHPAEGVRTPLAAVLPEFRFILLPHCGHRPWIERRARAAFYEILEREL